LLYFERATFKAVGHRTSDGFVVLKGSTLAIKLQPACPELARRIREKYSNLIDENGLLSVDVLLSSPSAAACFVGGSSLNGNIMWKAEDGRTLREIENGESV